MSQTVVLALSETWEFSSFAECLDLKDLKQSGTPTYLDGYLEISTPEGTWVRTEKGRDNNLESDLDDRADYESNEDLCEEFRRDVGNLHLFLFRFNDIALMRSVLRCIMRRVVDRNEIGWIDTDYGWVISAQDFLRRTDRDPDWDWRTPAEEDD